MSDLDESSDGSIFDEPYVPPTRTQPTTATTEQLDNDTIYRSQFDKTSANYHGGDTTLVPTGGRRVPDHMKEHSNWEALPEREITPVNPDEFGDKYAKIYQERETYAVLKKTANAVLPNVAALIKNRMSLEAAPTEQKKEHFKQLIATNTQAQLVALDALQKLMKSENWVTSPFSATLVTIHELASNLELSLEENQVLNEKVRRLSSQILIKSNALLQEMKKAKAEYLKNH